MNTERDELAKLIDDETNVDWFAGGPLNLADAILAAGYRKPRTITTAEELDALPELSIIMDSAGDVAQKRGCVWCSYETAPMTSERQGRYTPVTVIYEPEPTL